MNNKPPILSAPPADPTEYEPLPHNAKPMWLSLEEYLQMYAIECRRDKRPVNEKSIAEWIDLWYGEPRSHVLVNCGQKGIIPYCLITVYPEDMADLKRLREKRVSYCMCVSPRVEHGCCNTCGQPYDGSRHSGAPR